MIWMKIKEINKHTRILYRCRKGLLNNYFKHLKKEVMRAPQNEEISRRVFES
jgi:succinate dehydrogenase flavin-adding protein (antitoxin of CptAB toxin-antitoxin module)